MKKQIVVIHGGSSFKTYKDYLSYLKNKEIIIEKLRPRKEWKDWLASKLGARYDVLLPRMPNATNARYQEWKIWFNNITKVLNHKVVLVGHSLGGIFLAKYLTENIYPRKIAAVILVAAPFYDAEGADGKESLKDFSLPPSLKKFAKQCGKIYLLHSQDDPVVPFAQLDRYKNALPKAEAVVFKDREHFNQETFPEIVKIIESV
jgi:predicted alpha/beta hydrolase family esterase